jgi:hypothetical protein
MNNQVFNLQLLPVFFAFLIMGFAAVLFVFEPLILNDLFQVTNFESAHQNILLTIVGSILIGSLSLGIWVFKFLKSS